MLEEPPRLASLGVQITGSLGDIDPLNSTRSRLTKPEVRVEKGTPFKGSSDDASTLAPEMCYHPF